MKVYIEVANTLWEVTEHFGEDWQLSAEQAAVHAAVTGSVGGSHEVGEQFPTDGREPYVTAKAVVERARNITTDQYGRIES